MNMNMDMYNVTLMQDTPLGKGYVILPKYRPKKWEPKDSQFNTQLNYGSQSTGSTTTIDNDVIKSNIIIEEHKQELLDKLHAGQGELSMEEWNDFLLELTDLGLITNGQRLEAMGYLIPLPDMEPGSFMVTYEQKSDPYDAYLLNHWKGDPLDYLEKLDFYLYKQMLGAKLNHVGTTGIENTRKTYNKVADIVKELLL